MPAGQGGTVMDDAQAAPNAAQAEYWNTAGGATWVAMQALLDRQMAPLSRAAIDALAPGEGERILDIGCGCGGTTLELASRVGPQGAVTGVDVSAPMLEVARRRADETGAGQVRFIEADAQVHVFARGGFDAAFSRFGVMFFDDPPAAFANVRRALKPGGRLVFLCWRAMAMNPWMTVPLQAALKYLPVPAPADPLAPGPFAFADGERVRGILAAAGFSDIRLEPHDERIGAASLADAVTTATRVGPLGLLLRENPDRHEIVTAALGEAMAPYATDAGVLLPSATWIVRALA
jgi:ubiquinone/menaquinone biosynthesis C-methylase UbiE